jgi:hypothetical protein
MRGTIDRWTTAVKSEGIVIDRLQLAELSGKGIIQAHEDGLKTIGKISIFFEIKDGSVGVPPAST